MTATMTAPRTLHPAAERLIFECPDLGITFEAVYQELADHLEMELEEVFLRFDPDAAAARVRYHRRQALRRGVQVELAEAMGIDAAAVYAACGEEGARILLEALRAKAAWTVTTHPASDLALIDELEDAMAR